MAPFAPASDDNRMDMPRAEEKRRRTARALRVMLLTAGTATVVLCGQARAQQAPGLRGEVSEQEITGSLLKRGPLTYRRTPLQTPPADSAADQGIPTPTYRPESAGAVPEDEALAPTAGGSLFDEPGAEAPLPPWRPSTATQRAEAQDDAEVLRQQPEAENTRRPATAAETKEDIDAGTTGTVREPKADASEREDLTLDPGAERVEAIEGIDRRAEENPFEAPGIRMGTFILRPTVEQGITTTTNSDSSADGGKAVLSETTLRLNAVSDWSEHTATINAYGIFKKSVSGAKEKDIEGGIDASLEYDLGHEYRVNTALGYSIKPESASSPGVLTGTVDRPLRQTLTGSLGLEKDLGKLRFGLTGKVERNIFGDAEMLNGTITSQKDRNSTLSTVTLRTGYEISPALTPFVEVEVGRRRYDQQKDSALYERSSLRAGARAGLAVDMGEKLSGEFSAGWIREGFDDDNLGDISAASVNANLNWSPERGTTVGLTGMTTVEGTTTPNESGSVLYSGKLSLQRQIRANLTGNAVLGADWRNYYGKDGRDLTLSAEGSLTWWLNRYAGLTGRLRHERLESTLPGRDYTANSVFLGLKLQR